MRRLVAWIGGTVGGIAAYRLLRRRPQVAPEPSARPAQPPPDGRAAELRAKLSESRSTEPVVAEPPTETAAEQPPEPEQAESPEERRRRVHEEGRAALDEMKPDGAA